VIRKAGRNPRDVIEQSALWRRKQKDAGLISDSDPANDNLGNTNNAA
jgi:capsid protein